MITRLPAMALFHDTDTKTLLVVLSENDLSDADFGEVVGKALRGDIPKIKVADALVDGIRNSRFVVSLDNDWKAPKKSA